MRDKDDLEIIAAMTRAGVPRSCWIVSTKETGRSEYKDFAADVKKRASDRRQQTAAYVRHKSNEGLLDVEILAKELVLAGVQTRYTTFHKLARDLRMEETADEQLLGAIYARGAFVLPHIPPLSEIHPQDVTRYNETIEYLIAHAYEGGVLIIAGTYPLSKRLKSGLPPLFERLLVESAKTFEVS